MATMKDVARAAGVSIATVSAVLSGAAVVSPKLRERVEAAIRDLGYARNAMARGLKRGKSSLIGLIVPDINNPFFTSFVDHVQNLAQPAGYSVLLGLSGYDVGRENELLSLMRSHQAAGTILCPSGEGPAYTDIAQRMGDMKIVLADNASEESGADTIVMDNALAARLATRHIIELGHRAIATITGPTYQYVSRARQQGFIASLHEAGIAEDESLILHGTFREVEAFAAAQELLQRKTRPTAIFVNNNLMLIGVMRAIAEAGLAVPDDISVVSIDDFAWAAAFQPALTVVRQPIAEMAASAYQQLMLRISGASAPIKRIVCSPELVVRGSCRPVGG